MNKTDKEAQYLSPAAAKALQGKTKKTGEKKPARKKRVRVPLFQKALPAAVEKLETERIASFMRAIKEFDHKAENATDQFEILCISTIGYVQPTARKILFEFTKHQS